MNKLIIDQFENLVDYITNQIDTATTTKDKNKHRFRLRHINQAITVIKKHPDKIKAGEDLANYHGVGKGIVTRIDEILKNKKLAEIKNVKNGGRKKLINELLGVNGIGRVKANELVDKYNVKSINDLKNKYKKKKIPLINAIALGLKHYEDADKRIPRTEITQIYEIFKQRINSLDPDLTAKFCGSYRRKLNTSGDIDVLITHKKVKTKKDYKTNHLKNIITEFKKSGTVKLIDDLTDNITTKYMGYIQLQGKPVRRIDVRFVSQEDWPAALLYFTGSGELNKIMRSNAKKMGYKLNEYGLWKNDKRIKIESERDIFKKLNMDYLPPSERDYK
jgi:DNA polymerase beta